MALIDSLISYWRLDESSGGAVDAHGGNHLTDNASVGAGTGKINGARDFELSSSQFLKINSNASLQTGDIDFTIQCWVNVESFPTVLPCGIVSKWRDAAPTQLEYWILYDNATQRFGFWVSAVFDGFTNKLVVANNLGTPSTGTWYHILGWHDSVNNLIGIAVNDGTPDTQAYSSGVFVGTAPLVVGAYGDGTRFYDGLVDEVAIWKRMLTSGERTALYNGGNGSAYPFGLPKVLRRRMGS